MRKTDLLKYINGELGFEESASVTEWINSSEANRRFFNSLKESYILATLPQERATEDDFSGFLGKYTLGTCTRERCIKNVFTIGLAISAAAVIALFVVLGISRESAGYGDYSNVVANSSSELLLHTLPDGSMIGLSPNSEIRYNNGFNSENRKLLLRGTCYFDVAKNMELPFKVKPQNLYNKYKNKSVTIQVTGTKFYTTTDSHDSDIMQIALEEGSVAVKMCNNGQKEIVSLKEGDFLHVSAELEAVKCDMSKHDNTMMGDMAKYLSFKDARLSDIVAKLSIIHHCKFHIANPEVADYLLTADFINNTLEDILSIFEVTMGIESSINQCGEIELY